MAKPKQDILVQISGNRSIDIWIDNPAAVLAEIERIKGINRTRIVASDGPIYCDIDPRYDVEEIADEIKELLSAESLGPNLQMEMGSQIRPRN